MANSKVKFLVVKLQQLRYLNRSIVFAFDLLFSLSGTMLSYVMVITFLGRWEVYGSIATFLLASTLISVILFWSAGFYKVIIRHSTLRDIPVIIYALIAKEFALVLVLVHLQVTSVKLIIFCAILDLLITTFLIILSRAFLVNIYYTILKSNSIMPRNALIYSTEGRSPMLAVQINNNINLPYRVVGFVTTNKKKDGIKISSQRVHYMGSDNIVLEKLFKQKGIEYVIFSSDDNFKRERLHLVKYCIKCQVKILMAGIIHDINDSGKSNVEIKAIQIEDLLGREEIEVDLEKISTQLENKVILVTGAAGSIGREISLQLVGFTPKKLVLLDNAETPLHNLKLQLEDLSTQKDIVFKVGDVRSKENMKNIFEVYKPDVIFHAAAYKHVPMMENNPCEAILTNVWGTINTARCSVQYGTGKFIMISTDKAVNPTNVMGASKRLAELCVQNLSKLYGSTCFITTRFGNVLGSNGSVIPRFKEQIATGGPVTVTHPDIIRYFMTILEACRLVLQAAAIGNGGEIFVFDMGKQVRITDLARNMIALSGFVPDVDIKIEYTGLREGEKLYEELLTPQESTKATQHNKIRIAPVENIHGETLDKNVRSLIRAAKKIDVEATVRLMKKIVPEFISNNSEFSKYDIND